MGCVRAENSIQFDTAASRIGAFSVAISILRRLVAEHILCKSLRNVDQERRHLRGIVHIGIWTLVFTCSDHTGVRDKSTPIDAVLS